MPEDKAEIQGSSHSRLNEFWEPEADAVKLAFPFGGLVLVLFGIFILRKPDLLYTPQLWGEDGAVFFKQQFELGFFQAVFLRYEEYVHFLPRVIAFAVSIFPLGWVPLLYHGIALLIGAVCTAWFARREFRKVIPSDHWRALACITFACIPTGLNIIGNIAFIQWYLNWLGFLLLLSPCPRKGKRIALFILVWAALALTAAGSLVLFPFWLLRFFLRKKKKEKALCLGCLAGSLLMVSFFSPSVAEGLGDPISAVRLVSRGVWDLTRWRVCAEILIGEHDPWKLANQLGNWLWVGSVGGAALCCVIAFVKGNDKQKIALGLGLLVALVSLVMLAAGRPNVIWRVAIYRTAWGGGRFFFLPIHILYLAFFVAASALPRWRLPVSPIAVAILLGACISFRIAPMDDLDWPAQARELENTIKNRETRTIEFLINPPWWDLEMRRLRFPFKDGRPVAEAAHYKRGF